MSALPPEAEALVQGTIQRLRDGYFVTAEYGRRDWWTDSVPVVLRDLARRLLDLETDLETRELEGWPSEGAD